VEETPVARRCAMPCSLSPTPPLPIFASFLDAPLGTRMGDGSSAQRDPAPNSLPCRDFAPRSPRPIRSIGQRSAEPLHL
jgi:hypothetical protein